MATEELASKTTDDIPFRCIDRRGSHWLLTCIETVSSCELQRSETLLALRPLNRKIRSYVGWACTRSSTQRRISVHTQAADRASLKKRSAGTRSKLSAETQGYRRSDELRLEGGGGAPTLRQQLRKRPQIFVTIIKRTVRSFAEIPEGVTKS